MSQYNRKGFGINCGGRNQYGITAEFIKTLRDQIDRNHRERAVENNKTNGIIERVSLDSLTELFEEINPNKENL